MVTIDSFEDGDISEYGGDTADYAVNTGAASDGTQSLEGSTPNTGIASTTGLPTYPAQGDNFLCDYGDADNANNVARFIWAAQAESGNPDGYYIENDPAGGSSGTKLYKVDGGTHTELASDPNTADPRGSIDDHFDITWESDGSITGENYDGGTLIATVNATDTTFTSGGIGFYWDNQNRNRMRWDHVRTTAAEELLTADVGTLTLSGPEPSTTGGAATLQADVGALALTGPEAALTEPGAAELTTDATLNDGGINITVYEDVGGDGSGANTDALGNSYDNSQTIALSGGATELNALPDLDGGTGNDYWLEIEFTAPSPLTGTPATLTSYTLETESGQELTADVGTLTLSGPEASISTTGSLSLNADVGTLTLSGPEATLIGDGADFDWTFDQEFASPQETVTLGVDVGTLSLSGPEATTVAQGQASTAADVGALALNGPEATAAVQGQATLAGDVGVLTLTGPEATLAGDQSFLAADAGVLTLTGPEAATAAQGSTAAIADAGVLTLTGPEAGLTQATGTTLLADAGLLSLSGPEASTVAQGSVALAGDVGALALTGPEATLVGDQAVLGADVGALVLTGPEASMTSAGATLVADAGALTLTAPEATTVAQGQATAFTADALTLTLTGQEAVISARAVKHVAELAGQFDIARAASGEYAITRTLEGDSDET